MIMTDKEIADYIKQLLPKWRKAKNVDSIFEMNIIIDELYCSLARLLEMLEND